PPADVRKRRKLLEELRSRLVDPPPPRAPRKVLKNPQPLLMQTGDVIAYPTSAAHPANPYFPARRTFNGAPWVSDGWGAAVIVDCGRAFDFLAWYRPLTATGVLSDKPVFTALKGERE